MNILRKIKDYWIKFGELLGKIVGPIFLTVIYFVFVGPMSLLARIMRKDFLRERITASSYWIVPEKNKIPGGGNLNSLEGMELPF
ncbi:MAG: hypothetical protein AAB551_03770 [Patescibacteria group bacterium]